MAEVTRDEQRALGGATLKCPFCAHLEDKVVDSRESKEGDVIRRRRECLVCGKRFTSYERIDQIPHLVVKKDGRRERFDREKVMAGPAARPARSGRCRSRRSRWSSTGSRPWCRRAPTARCPTDQIGEFLMERLQELDKVAFVRFASVYRDFKDVDQFMATLKGLLESAGTRATASRGTRSSSSGLTAPVWLRRATLRA